MTADAAGHPGGVERCAVAARRRSDRMWGTAAPARRLLLLEHPGPWSRQALASPGIRPLEASALGRAAAGSGTRPLLVRRPGRPGRRGRSASDLRDWWLVDLAARTEVRGTWTEDDGLTAVTATVTGWDGSGPDAGRAALVCTHGVHDACCAIWGRPVVDELATVDEDVWECSHVGGDRFAASAVLLPEGACYGGLVAGSATATVLGHRRGGVDGWRLRGLMALDAPAQAAVSAALHDHGPAGIDDVRVEEVRVVGEDTWEVDLAGRRSLPVRLTARVLRTWGDPVRLTCLAGRDSAPFAFTVEWLGT